MVLELQQKQQAAPKTTTQTPVNDGEENGSNYKLFELPSLPTEKANNHKKEEPPVPPAVSQRPSLGSKNAPAGFEGNNKRPYLSTNSTSNVMQSQLNAPNKKLSSADTLSQQQAAKEDVPQPPRRSSESSKSVPRKMSAQDYKDLSLPSAPLPSTSDMAGKRSRKFSEPAPPPPSMNKGNNTQPGQRSRKQSVPASLLSRPTPNIGNPVLRQTSFQDYKNDIVPIPETPTSKKQNPVDDGENDQDLYLADDDLKGIQESSSFKNKEKNTKPYTDIKGNTGKPEISRKPSNLHKNDKSPRNNNKNVQSSTSNQIKHREDEDDDHPKDYQKLDMDQSVNQDIYLDLGELS